MYAMLEAQQVPLKHISMSILYLKVHPCLLTRAGQWEALSQESPNQQGYFVRPTIEDDHNFIRAKAHH